MNSTNSINSVDPGKCCICIADKSGCFPQLDRLLNNALGDSGVKIIIPDKHDRISCERCIIITDGSEETIDFLAKKAAVIIPHEDVRKGAYKSKHARLITVGTNKRAALSCSSLCGASLMISLQRGFTGFDGKELVPCEYCIKHPSDPYSEMALLAVRLLLGSAADSSRKASETMKQ